MIAARKNGITINLEKRWRGNREW